MFFPEKASKSYFMVCKTVLSFVIFSWICEIGLIAQISPSHAMEQPDNQEAFSYKAGQLAGDFYNKINNGTNWRYSTSTSPDLNNYQEHLSTTSPLWEVLPPNQDPPYIEFQKKVGCDTSEALDSIIESSAIIDCRRVLCACLSNVVSRMVGDQTFNMLCTNAEKIGSPMALDTIVYRFFIKVDHRSLFRESNTIGHFGYFCNAGLFEVLNDTLVLNGVHNKYHADSGFHAIIVGKDETDQSSLYTAFGPDFKAPRKAQEIKGILLESLFGLLSGKAEENSNLFQVINTYYQQYSLLLQSNEEIKTSLHLRELIERDYEESNKDEFSKYLNQKCIETEVTNLQYNNYL